MEPRPPVAAVIQQCQPGICQRRLVMALALFIDMRYFNVSETQRENNAIPGSSAKAQS